MRERLRRPDSPQSIPPTPEPPVPDQAAAAQPALGFDFGSLAIFPPEPALDREAAQHPADQKFVAPSDAGALPASPWFGTPIASPLERARETAGAYWNHNLDSVTVHERHADLAHSPLDALTVGRDVYLSPRLDPDSAHGQHVLAHEFSHTVQQARGVHGSYADLETDAERDAHASRTQAAPASGSSPVRQSLPAPAQPRAQAFDPRYHRESLVNGLSENKDTGEAASGFTPEEIGAIYAANWERDLSQAHPSLGNVILAWKAVKLTAVQPGASQQSVQEKEAGFVAACASVLDQVQAQGVDAFANAQASYRPGDNKQGYAFWEHMDNPGAGLDEAITKADVKLQMPDNPGALPTHIVLSREYIKQMLFEAVQQAFRDADPNSNAGKAATASQQNATALRGAKLDSSVPLVPADGKPPPPLPPPSPVLPGVPAGANASDPSASVRADTAAEVRDTKGGTTPPGAQLAGDKRYELLGRASHALEDFWAHSNFVEVAIGEPARNPGQPPITGITTGTFDEGDKKHALAHKIRSISDEILAEKSLIEHATGRSSRLPAPQEIKVGDISRPAPESDHDEAHGNADLAGRTLDAMGEADLWDAFVRNPATFGGAAGGAVGGYFPDSSRGASWNKPDLNNIPAFALGSLAGTATGAATGFLGGAMAAGNAADRALGGGTAGLVGGTLAAGVGGVLGLVTGAVSGLVGGSGGSQAGHDTQSAAEGALAGANVFGSENLVKVAFSLGGSASGAALLRSVAEKLESDSRDEQKNKPESHTNLAKDQPGHDDDAADALKTVKFDLAHALSSAGDRLIIGKMHAVLAASDAGAALTKLDEINTTLDSLIAAPSGHHLLSGIVDAHRARAEAALNARYQK